MSSANWTKKAVLSQVAPDALKNSIDGLNIGLDKATEVVNFIKNGVQVAEAFFTAPGDLLIAFLNNYSSAFYKAVADALSLGGGFIWIDPYNRVNVRMENILPTATTTTGGSDQIIYPMTLPTMTPQEALNEFYASFSNTADPFRPQWTDNVEVTGFGFLLCTPDPTTLVQLTQALKPILKLAEIDDLQKKLVNDVQAWYDTTVSMIGSDFSNFLHFDITGLKTENYSVTYADGTVSDYKSTLFDDNVSSLHWYGLSLDNFTYLKDVEKVIVDLVNSLLGITQTVNNFVREAGDALIRKLEVILALIKNVVAIIKGFLVALNSSGVYYFEVPRAYGGVAYIQQAIQSSLSSPSGDAQTLVPLLNTMKFSALFFAGVGAPVNLDAWDKMFKNAWSQTSLVAQALFAPQFSVLPNFDHALFTFGKTITLQVVSQEATNATPLNFTYKITDGLGATVHSFENQTGNIAKVNQDRFNIVIPVPASKGSPVGTLPYHLKVVVFGNAGSTAYTADFYVTDSLVGISSTLDPTNSPTITTGNCGGTMSLVNNNIPGGGSPMEKVYISANSTTSLGSSISPELSNITMKYTSSCPDASEITVPVTNNKAYRIGNVNALPVPSSFRFLSFPAKICFNFVGSFRYRLKGATTWKTITLPACFSVESGDNYEYFIFTPTTGWQGLFVLNIVQQATEGTQVC